MLGDTLQATTGGQSRPGPWRPHHPPPAPRLKEQGLEARPGRKLHFQTGLSRKARGDLTRPIGSESAGG